MVAQNSAGRQLLEGAAYATRFFRDDADVHHTLTRLVRNLDEAGILYALAGAMALNAYGYRRVTVDVNVILTKEGLDAFKARFLGRGYVEKFPGSKGLRDADTGVAIDILIAGQYPGDGLVKPVAFPDPATVAERQEGVAWLPLAKLVELKLASGMTAPHRLKDLADVIELVRAANLSADFSTQLDPFVRDKYRELWHAAQVRDPG